MEANLLSQSVKTNIRLRSSEQEYFQTERRREAAVIVFTLTDRGSLSHIAYGKHHAAGEKYLENQLNTFILFSRFTKVIYFCFYD